MEYSDKDLFGQEYSLLSDHEWANVGKWIRSNVLSFVATDDYANFHQKNQMFKTKGGQGLVEQC